MVGFLQLNRKRRQEVAERNLSLYAVRPTMRNTHSLSTLDTQPSTSMDDLERDKFYVAPPDSDDDEYELEEPDTTVDEVRKQAVLDSLKSNIDIDAVYQEAERNRGTEILENWLHNFRFRFRFQVKHLLFATAVLSIALTLVKLQLFWTAVIVLFMAAVAGLYGYLKWEERKHQIETDRKREEMYAKRRAQLAAKASGHVVGGPVVASPPVVSGPPQPTNEIDSDFQAAIAKEPFRFQFSLRQLLLTMTAAAVALGMLRLMGSPEVTATVLGLVALFGLIIYAMGYEPPQVVVLGWWFTLVLYVGVSILAAVWASMA